MSASSSLTDINEPVLDPPGPDATPQEYRAYIQQQAARYEVLRNRATPPVSKGKPFYIKVLGNKPGLFAGDSYKEWTQYIWEMENQFDMNQVDDSAKNPDKVKLSFAVTFLKRGSSAQLLWNAKAKNNPGKEYTWKKYVDFLKENTQKASTRKEDNFQKYKDYTQRANQSVRNYDAHRIALVADLHPTMKPSPAIELQDFILNLTQDNQDFLAEQGIEDNKEEILKRLKCRENNERKKQRSAGKNKPKNSYNKRKKGEEDSDKKKKTTISLGPTGTEKERAIRNPELIILTKNQSNPRSYDVGPRTTGTMEDPILSDETDSSLDESSTTDTETKSAKRRRRKLRMAKCKKTMVKVNKRPGEKDKLKFEAVMDPGTEISLISNTLAKQLGLEPSNVPNCEAMTIDNHPLKTYDVYFVQFEVQDENDVNRFFNDSFIETDLTWDMTLSLP
ncbi:structure-specific endonuclease subunit SLX1 [Physcia stellaris]|nr:structure-specific endonuclease subunit SLX1 [Physcia stellaris]